MFLVPGEVGGSEPLLTNLTLALAEFPVELTVFGIKGFSKAYPQIAAKTEVVEVPWSQGAQGLRIAAEHSWLISEARKQRLDLVHHGVGTTPYLSAKPMAVTLHDIQYQHFPDNFVKLKRAWLKLNVPHTVKRCAAICVPSEWVRQDVISRLRADPDRISVVPFGSSDLFPEQVLSAEEAKAKYRLERPYFIYPSRTYPHKNHAFLVDAFAKVVDDVDLVLTGPPWFRDDALRAQIAGSGLGHRVRHLGLVPRGDLAGLYRGAIALVYPTLFEGFGAPALEAMSLGLPVIASDVTAIPEVIGEAGLLLRPDDIQAWADAMNEISTDAGLRQQLTALGVARAAAFTWNRSAELQVAAYERALSA